MTNRSSTAFGRNGAFLLTTIAVLLSWALSLRADEAMPSAEPLARCELQSAVDGNQQRNMLNAGLAIFQQRSVQPLDQYQRGFGSQWRVPAEVDADDPNLRLLLLAPTGPVILDVAVYINGQPFRAIRERWIDGAVNGEDLASIMAQQSGEAKSAMGDGDATESDDGESAPDADSTEGEPATDAEATIEEENEATENGDDDSPAAEDDDSDSAEADASEEPDEDAQEEEPGDEPKRVEAKRYQAPDALQRLTQYVSTLDGPVDRSEARWLLAEWVPGPSLMELRDGFGWERAAIAPVVALLDQDRDGQLSSAEIDGARAQLVECDRNEDDSVTLAEINRKLGKDANAADGWTPPRLLVSLNADTEWSALAHDLEQVYPLETDGDAGAHPGRTRLARQLGIAESAAWTPQDLQKLLSALADVTVQVHFGPSGDQPAGVAITAINGELGTAEEVLGTSKDVITLDLDGFYVEISAAPGGDTSGQVSCGAVVDGYPLMRHLDIDGDRRFTLREIREISDSLSQFDRDGDHRIDASEIRTPIRLAVAQGPNVHAMLEAPTVAALRAKRRQRQEAPVWFTPMDANGDGDVTRGEFFGTDDQFRRLDADGDGLVSVAEAIASEAATADETGNESEGDAEISDSENREPEKSEAETPAAGEDSAASSEQPAEE